MSLISHIYTLFLRLNVSASRGLPTALGLFLCVSKTEDSHHWIVLKTYSFWRSELVRFFQRARCKRVSGSRVQGFQAYLLKILNPKSLNPKSQTLSPDTLQPQNQSTATLNSNVYKDKCMCREGLCGSGFIGVKVWDNYPVIVVARQRSEAAT